MGAAAKRNRLFLVLADETRRALVERLSRSEASVSVLAADFPVTRGRISQHLAVLKAAGLVIERKSGRFRYYRLKPERLDDAAEWIRGQQERFWRERLQAFGRTLDEHEE